jgi:uncharacterized membrane protein YhfC
LEIISTGLQKIILFKMGGLIMISSTSMVFMLITAVVSFLIPIGVFIYFRKKQKAAFKPVLIGILTFILFTQVLEKLLHYVVITNKIIPNPIMFTIYGALAAGIFEEVGRFIMYKAFLKKNRQWKDGVAFGIGHGGIEAILIGGFTYINFFIYSQLINSGNFDQIASKLPASTVEVIKNALMAPSYTFLLGSIERISALVLQIGFSIIVLYAVKERKNIYLLLAIILHAFIDFPAGLYQLKVINNIVAVEAMIVILAVIAFVYIIRSKKHLKEQNNSNTVSV